ncbi:MAG TPA: feruloyl-CoA synthase, partial [Rubrivivax sp.]|nr:feruloyl-CoA synthase [Rubrivivax sp.]
MQRPRYRDARVGGCLEAAIDRRADGTLVLRSTEALRWFPERLTDCLEQWAAEAPERVFVARRLQGGDWRRIGYAQMLQRVRSVAQALLERGL